MLKGKGGKTRISRIITNADGRGHGIFLRVLRIFAAIADPCNWLSDFGLPSDFGFRVSDFSSRTRSRRQVKKTRRRGLSVQAHSLSPLMFEPVSRLSPVHPARRPGAPLVLLALSLACAPSPKLPGHWQESGRLLALTYAINLAGGRRSVCQGNPYLLCKVFPYKKSVPGRDRDRRRAVLLGFRAIS